MARTWLIAAMTGWGSFGAWAWIILIVQFVIHRRLVIQLKDCPAEPPEGGWPSLSVVFAARNEAGTVGQATRSILAQDYPGLVVVAVDDRSTDGTGPILDALAGEDAWLRVVHVRELPPGWLGKNHALQTAAESVSSDWLLFTDADVVFAPDALKRAVALAVSGGLDHLTLAPDMPTESFGERIFVSMFILLFALSSPPSWVLNPRKKASVGVGAFNLVRAEAFRSIGGFCRLALSVDDDMRLGQALKFGGYRNGICLGQSTVSVRWQVGLGGMIRGLEKNFFAALDFRLALVPFAVLAILTVGVMPYVGLFVGRWWQRAICAAGVASVVALLGAMRGQNGVRWYHGLSLPVGALAMVAALLRSVAVTLWNGGIRWRDHDYPLAELKDHVRLRNAWASEVWRSTR